MSNFSIRLHLEECHQVKVADGGKATCPFCQHLTLSIKGDELAKCFHPSCGRFINQHSVQSSQAHLQQLFWAVMDMCHQSLQNQANEPNHTAYSYLLNERKVHSKLLEQSPVIGVIPKTLSIEENIRQHRIRLQAEAEIKTRDALLKEFDEQVHHLKDFLTRLSGWLVFGYTNANHKLISFKFREPYSKKFAQFKPTEQIGVFNPIPFDTEESRLFPYVLLAEGEFNILSLQSLLFQNNLSPALAMALGSASATDWFNLRGFKEKWLLFQDSDEAGSKLAEAMQEHRTFYLTRSPLPDDDLDSFIQRQDNPQTALEALQKLIFVSETRYRTLNSIIKDLNRIRRKETQRALSFEINQSVSKLLTKELLERGTFYKTVLSPYFLDQATQTLYPLHKGEKKTQRLLHSFSLNPAESIHGFVLHELERLAHEQGLETTIQRFAHYDQASNQIYLFNKDTEVFRISTGSIEIVSNGTDGVLFETLPGYIPFDRQEIQLDCELLFSLYTNRVNFQEGVLSLDEYQRLLEAWVYHLFFDELHATHPILSFVGPKGSSKTSSIRRLGMLLFGSGFQVSAMPEKPDDFDAITTNAFLAAFDNVDGSTAWMNDKLAIAATGGTIRKRELYSTNNLIEFPIRATLAITSRTPKFRRDDVAERLLIFPLKTLEQKISEQNLVDEIKKQRNRFMSWLLLKLQEILKDLEKTRNLPPIQTNLRMADFATFMIRLACAKGQEESVYSLLDRLAATQSQFTLEQDPLFELLELVAVRHSNHPFKTADLHSLLKELALQKGIKYSYGSPNSLGQRLFHIKNNLEEFINIVITSGPNNVKYYQFSLKSDGGS